MEPIEQDDGHITEGSDVKGAGQEKEVVIGENDPSLLIRTEERQGSKPGNVRVRLVRPSHHLFPAH